MKVRFVMLLFLVLLTSCATVINREASISLPKDKTYYLLPFVNYTESPKAGMKVQSIVAGVLQSKGYKVVLVPTEEELTDEKKLEELYTKTKGKKGIAVLGTVNEWRYKTGIDGEPAVSITLRFVDMETDKPINSMVLSRSGWSYESLGVVTQRILNKAIE
ncbi:hypothetical protein [Thermocrinis minervae]|uniref:Penicillin-binding protein activator LpoB n=1 Tax=Thermocrinis minervae TaxID=381751 RepID=A0A1M6Q993_9AQUI|nr:hypothetical protein [Thermocrinis minervae]SHK16720.1 hypothetical protein SAMN05444391_0131 [Thermocrinis minervae]